jgi:hypothetical protein
MVERIMRDPAVVPITESAAAGSPVAAVGPCMVCAGWIGTEDDAFVVSVTRRGGDATELLAHVRCLRGVSHASIALPRQHGDVAADYLNPKPRTPSGR